MLEALDPTVLSAFTLLWIAVVPTPGPNVLMVMHLAMTRPPTHVAVAIAGNLAGIALLAGLALIGWSAVLQAFPWLRIGVNVLGGLYLMWTGARLLRRARAGSAASGPALQGGQGAMPSLGRTALQGLVTALSNAQAILFITSIFAVAGVLSANAATGMATLAIMLCCNGCYLSALGWLFQRQRMRAAYARFRGVLDGTMGALFLLFGGRLLWRALAR